MSNETVVVNGTLYWPFLNRVNDMSGKYQVDVACLSPGAVNALEMMGLAIANKGDDRGSYITIKSKFPIRMFDAATKDEVAADLIGNGTVANVAVGYYDWTFKTKTGRSGSIKRALITELASFEKEELVSDSDMDIAL